MYQIKQKPEDFIVKEIPKYKLESGPYSYFWLKKTNYNTVSAVKKLAQILKIPMKNIGFAGSKDKIAVTEQVISIKNIKKEIKIKDLETKFIGTGKDPISLGDLEGNEFIITIRSLDEKQINKLKQINNKEIKILNLFGPQRFSKNNKEIGKAIIKKDFKKAAELIDQSEVKEHLKHHPNDSIGAIKKLPLKIVKIYVNAYQSYLWNQLAEKLKDSKQISIPIIGFGTELDEQIKEILKQENIILRDFIIPQFPELTQEGNQRNLFIKTKINVKIKDAKAIIQFKLPKSSYATEVIRQLF